MSENSTTKYVWDVGDMKKDSVVTSPVFELKSDPNIKCSMFAVFHNNGTFWWVSSVGVALYGLEGKDFIELEAFFSFGSRNESFVCATRTNHVFKKSGDAAVLNFGVKEPSMVSTIDSRLMPTVRCSLSLTPLRKISPQMLSSQQDLRPLLWAAYEKGSGSDVTIQVDTKEYKISSLVLVSQSKVFENMLSSDRFKEALTKKIEIKDFSVSAMDAFIRYLHLGEVDNEEVIEELFELSDKYEVKELKNFCDTLVIRSLTEENAARRLVMSMMHNNLDLQGRITESIHKMSATSMIKIFQSDTWNNYLSTARDQA